VCESYALVATLLREICALLFFKEICGEVRMHKFLYTVQITTKAVAQFKLFCEYNTYKMFVYNSVKKLFDARTERTDKVALNSVLLNCLFMYEHITVQEVVNVFMLSGHGFTLLCWPFSL
jgi:hypothetical protein